ncbi:MAG: cation:proton antiporter [Peptococcaceae bacterium]
MLFSAWGIVNDLGYALTEILNKNGFLKELVIIFFTVKVLGHISIKFGQPSLFGQLLVGVILGPSVLDILHTNIILKELAQVGVLMLMFLAGLETDLADFKKTAIPSLFVAVGGVILPLVGGTVYGFISGYAYNVSVFIGVVLVATSVSISVQTLRELERLRSPEGCTILGAAVIDDILGLIILSIVLSLTIGGEEITVIGVVILKIIAFFIFATIAGYIIVPLMMFMASKILVSEGKLTFALIIVFILSLAAEYLGLAGIVGAYFAGIMIGRNKARQEITQKIEALGHAFFFPIFFVSIGIIADINSVTGELVKFSLMISFIAVFSKILGSGLGAFLSGFSLKSSAGIGAGMVSRGEVALIVANIGLTAGLLTIDLYTVLVAVTIITTVITPVLLKAVFR